MAIDKRAGLKGNFASIDKHVDVPLAGAAHGVFLSGESELQRLRFLGRSALEYLTKFTIVNDTVCQSFRQVSRS